MFGAQHEQLFTDAMMTVNKINFGLGRFKVPVDQHKIPLATARCHATRHTIIHLPLG